MSDDLPKLPEPLEKMIDRVLAYKPKREDQGREEAKESSEAAIIVDKSLRKGSRTLAAKIRPQAPGPENRSCPLGSCQTVE